MPDAVTHPTSQELAAFGLGKLPEDAAAVVAAHLETCPACQQAVAEVSADPFLKKLRDAGRDAASSPPSVAQPHSAPSSASQPAAPLAPCPDLPPELARHPKYHILRELGRGGMGVVYQARQTVMNRLVVIKVINRALLDRPDSLERFRREIRAAAQLSHPNIVTAYDAEQIGDSHILVMEFVPGRSLAEVVHKKGPLSVEHACHFARQVAQGLQHAHERKMVHRDIKPQNLMLTMKNQIKILDFGLAKVVREESTSTGSTSNNTYMGTPDYCAPEQATDARSADIRADLYSLGCTLYYLLAGRPPFKEDTFVKIIFAHRDKAPQPLTELRSDVPERLWRVVARLLAKKPNERYQKPIEAAAALAPFVNPESKPDAKDASTPPQGVNSPTRGTKIAADTNQIKEILREAPAKRPPKEQIAHPEASAPSAGQTGSAADWDDDEESNPPRAAWWKSPGLLAIAMSASLALIVMTAILINIKPATPTQKVKPPLIAPVIPDNGGKMAKVDPIKPNPQQKPDVPVEEPGKPEIPAPFVPHPKINPPVPPEMANQSIETAIENGVKALRKMQRPDGTWPHQHIGATALAGLALLACDVSKEDKQIISAAYAVRKASISLTHTESIALSILFLDRLGGSSDAPLIKSLAARLLAGYDAKSGGWSNNCPQPTKAEMRRLQGFVDNREEAAASQQGADQPMIRGLGDTSNTQLAILGLWVGRRHGTPIDRVLARLAQRSRKQVEDGGWANNTTVAAGTMTCAGLFGLVVGSTARTSTLNPKTPDNGKEGTLQKGIQALSAMIGQPLDEGSRQGGQSQTAQEKRGIYYFLWTLECVAVAVDLKAKDNKDWYDWGKKILLESQAMDGRWKGEYAAGGVDTSFALLFLKRADLTPGLTPLVKRKQRQVRWRMMFRTGGNAADYVAQLQALGAILAFPVSERGDDYDYQFVRNLAARPVQPVPGKMSEYQDHRIQWRDGEPTSVRSVLRVLGLPPRIPDTQLHFVAIMPKPLEEELSRLEIDHLHRNYPGRSEDDIFETKFVLERKNGNYELKVNGVILTAK